MIMDRDFIEKVRNSNGLTCPCCDQFAKVYRRAVNATMAWQLIRLRNLNKTQEWVHVRDLVPPGQAGTGDFPKMRYWGLIEECPEGANEDKKSGGLWRITAEGELYVDRSLHIRKYVLVYNSEPLGFDGEHVDIKNALGEKFSYSKLMGNSDAYARLMGEDDE